MKKLLNRLAYYISVPKCVYCGERLEYGERALCANCMKLYRENKTRNCSRCAKVLEECSCPNGFLEKHGVKQVFKVYRYVTNDGRCPSNDIIYALKNSNRRDVFSFLAEEVATSIKRHLTDITFDNTVIINIPRRRSAVVHFGYDHAAKLAREVSKLIGAKYTPLLKSNAKKQQKELSQTERLKNADFKYRKKANLKGKRVIIVDDIITTGSSMCVAATLLRGLGARKIYAASVAIAYKEDKVIYNRK